MEKGLDRITGRLKTNGRRKVQEVTAKARMDRSERRKEPNTREISGRGRKKMCLRECTPPSFEVDDGLFVFLRWVDVRPASLCPPPPNHGEKSRDKMRTETLSN